MRVRWCIREVQDNYFSAPFFAKRNGILITKFDNKKKKWSLQAICCFWAALPGAKHLERCFALARKN